ncbi:MAG TPA: alpha/beta fold hydrolase, partial [Labilithrix sp.]|nr:alpha/beta fold hydrolase [Labilithrix sp.]
IHGFVGGLFAITALVGYASGCTESTPKPLTSGDGGSTSTAPLAEPATPCDDTDEAIYGDPGPIPTDPASLGKVLKCSKGPELTKEAIQARLTELGYKGKPLTSGARTYKVVYRTTRGDAAGSPGYSSAIVYVPTVQRAEKLPIVVAGRGSRGQAARCAVSKLSPELVWINEDANSLTYTLVGQGYAVMYPDLAGYANFGAANNPISGYAEINDVGRSTLDGSRAMKELYPQLDDKTVLVGHSQGGHSALAALALAESYGVQGTIAGLALYAPLWMSQRLWAAILDPALAHDRDLTIADYTTPSVVSIWYHYTHAELLDGPGEGIKLFKPEKREIVQKFVNESCWHEPELIKNNAKFVYEYFEDSFTSAVGAAAAGLAECNGNATCDKWIARYKADRPNLTGAAAQAPLLLLYGSDDETIPDDRMQCALDRLKEDRTNLTVCYEQGADHSTVINATAEHVADWIASLTLGSPAPSSCAANESALTAVCATPPPND